MNIKKHIPNIITLLNLFCGCIALVFVANNEFQTAFFFVCLGIFLDFFDGFFARLFKVSSPLGLQLDSLADMVTSGVVPGFVMYKMLLSCEGCSNASCLGGGIYVINTDPILILPYISFIITLGACYRLANFNIDSRQTDSFIGLPTPANTLFIMSLPLIGYQFLNWHLILFTLLSAYLMNAEMPLFSLKIKKLSFAGNELQIIFLLISLLLLVFFQFLGVALVIVFYVLLSVVRNKFVKK
jgi:CDP-diacylglycerol---serine O-phosphatidyltransferase